MDKITLVFIISSIVLSAISIILYTLLQIMTKEYCNEWKANSENIANKYIFIEFFKQITELLPKDKIIICLKNAVKICENNNSIKVDVFSKDNLNSVIDINKYDIISEKLYKQFSNNEEKGVF